MSDFIHLKLEDGNQWLLQKDQVTDIEYTPDSRNLRCMVNGRTVESGFDFIVKELAIEVPEVIT